MNCTVANIFLATRCRSVSGSPSNHALSSTFIARNNALTARKLQVFGDKSQPVNNCPRFPFDIPRPRPRTKGEKALHYLAEQRLENRDVNDLIIDLARVLGAEL